MYVMKVRSPDPRLIITILDPVDEVIFYGTGADFDQALSPGLYTIRTQLDGVIHEQVVRHDSARDMVASIPQRSSAAPLQGTRSMAESFAAPAASTSSGDETTSAFGEGMDSLPSGLFVFLRSESAAEDLGDGFSLWSKEDQLICEFSADHTKRGDGWLAFKAPTPRTQYWLKYRPQSEGSLHRIVPISTYAGWQTQVFLVHETEPRFDAMRVFMDTLGHGFSASNDVTLAVDRATQQLQARLTEPANDVDADQNNPLLNLLRLQALCGAGSNEDRQRSEALLIQLETSIPESADVQALRILHSDRYSVPLPEAPLAEVPMLRQVASDLIEATFANPDISSLLGPIRDISSQLVSSATWTSWWYDPEIESQDLSPLQESALHVVDQHLKTEMQTNMKSLAEKLAIPVSTLELAIEDLDRIPAAEKTASITRMVELSKHVSTDKLTKGMAHEAVMSRPNRIDATARLKRLSNPQFNLLIAALGAHDDVAASAPKGTKVAQLMEWADSVESGEGLQQIMSVLDELFAGDTNNAQGTVVAMEAASPQEPRTRPEEKTPLDLWKEKLHFFQQEEVFCSDPGKLFSIRKEIETIEARIRELEQERK